MAMEVTMDEWMAIDDNEDDRQWRWTAMDNNGDGWQLKWQ